MTTTGPVEEFAEEPPEPPGVPLGPRAVRLATILEAATGRTVMLPELWVMWAEADPASAGSPERRARLGDALTELAVAGLITASRKLDTSASPHLPSKVTLPPPAPSASAAALAQTVVWRPELSWVLGARLTVGQVEHLRLINGWLRDRGRDTDRIPLRERSVEILGYEKALDRLLATTAFGPDRLDLDHLRTYRTHPPLPCVKVGDGPVLLVVENDDTFHSIRNVLTRKPGQVGHVAWGAGAAFEASIRTTGDVQGITRVRYFGDIDATGLRIPTNAAATATREDLPPVVPAAGLYEALLLTPVRQGGQRVVADDQADALTRWLDDDSLSARVAAVLTAGARVPQEALSLTALSADQSWIDGL